MTSSARALAVAPSIVPTPYVTGYGTIAAWGDRLDRAAAVVQEAIDAAVAERTATLREALSRVEWLQEGANQVTGEPFHWCPECEAVKESMPYLGIGGGHRPDCRLRAALATSEQGGQS